MEKDSLAPGRHLLVIGGSAGSLEVLLQVFPLLAMKTDLAIIIVLHRRNDYDSLLLQLLSSKTIWQVREAEDKEALLPGVIYIAPADYHLLVEKEGLLALDDSEKVNYSRPSIDVTLESAAHAYGPRLSALLLSGANTDGTQGLKAVREQRGITAVQDPLSAAVSYMPKYAFEQVDIDHVLSITDIVHFINALSEADGRPTGSGNRPAAG